MPRPQVLTLKDTRQLQNEMQQRLLDSLCLVEDAGDYPTETFPDENGRRMTEISVPAAALQTGTPGGNGDDEYDALKGELLRYTAHCASELLHDTFLFAPTSTTSETATFVYYYGHRSYTAAPTDREPDITFTVTHSLVENESHPYTVTLAYKNEDYSKESIPPEMIERNGGSTFLVDLHDCPDNPKCAKVTANEVVQLLHDVALLVQNRASESYRAKFQPGRPRNGLDGGSTIGFSGPK